MTCGGDELAELLRRAGLEVVGDGRGENVLPTQSAWRWTGSPEARTVVAVRAGRAGPSAEVDARWHRLAVELGIMGADGEFLIDVAGKWKRCSPQRWTRVRLTPDWSLAALLGDGAERPELATGFVTLSPSGGALLGVTTEGAEVRLVTVSGVRERQEAAAHAQARETPRERAAAWASLFRGEKHSDGVREAWAHGLALNPATPDDLRGDLLGLSHHLLWRPLPTVVVEAAIVHPDWKVRQLLAEAQPGLTADQWTRLILGEENSRRRWILSMIAADRRDVLDEAVQQRLAADPSAQVREEAARLTGLPARILTALATDPEPAVRAEACRAAWPHLDEPARRRLLTDPDSKVRATALLRHHQDHPLSRSVFDAEGLTDGALGSCLLERDLAEHLAHHGDEAQRGSLAGNPCLDPDLVALLARDLDERVRDVVARRPDLTEEQRAAIPLTFDPGTHHHSLDWVEALHHDPAAMRRLATSAHPLVRRSVARARRLPPDVVELLARDEDRVVQLFLAESCDDAPADMLLRVWQWWTGSLTAPDRPRGHPNFPRTGLLRYADDPNPRMRRLAPDDPESTPELVERLSRDPSEEVRHRAATDPRLTVASAIRLLDDPRDSVRHAAARHPRLPALVLVRLLGDRDTAQDAARHPALPVAVIRQMIEHLRG
ncbi:PE-PGRS family protein [Streptomyces sp. NPDC058268]|uniref:PE-PGRS family protein n=1 Tax=Streptomyces sp. NPDC058268 TaxID=3346413 RepID=UPI0036F03208